MKAACTNLIVATLSIVALILASTPSYGQPITPGSGKGYTIGGKFDTLYDNNGKKWHISQLKTPNAGGTSVGNPSAKLSTLSTCANSGYFTLWFEQGWGGSLSVADQANAEAVICQVFKDISAFLIRPTGATDNVQIWVRDIVDFGIANPQTSDALGGAVNFNYLPVDGGSNGGITDNTIWLTINGGKDAYTNIASPLVSSAPQTVSGAGYFHGLVAINFSNPNILWNLSVANAPGSSSGQYDLYTVLLHEIMHSLGFGSYITVNTNTNQAESKFGALYNYFSRYDKQLKLSATATPPNAPIIRQQPGACNSLYQYTVNPAVPLSYFCNGCGTAACPPVGAQNNSISCTNTINYNSAAVPNIPVFNPTCFDGASSFSHFEDECPITGGSCGAACEDKFYVMSNATLNNIGKRVPQEHERSALCDIGYNVATTFGSLAANNTYTYTATACDGKIRVVGYCDGINNGGFTWSCAPGGTVNIPIQTVVQNDYNVNVVPLQNGIECVEVINSTGSTAVISGTDIVFTAAGNAGGVALIRYTPLHVSNGTTYRGNITYIYVRINTVCPATPCGNLLYNGNFEDYTPGGCECSWPWYPVQVLGFTDYDVQRCWTNYLTWPGYMSKLCTGAPSPTFILPTNGSPTWGMHCAQPGISTHNANNTRCILLMAETNGSGNANITQCATQQLLSTQLMPNGWYTLKFKALATSLDAQCATLNNSSAAVPCTLSVAGSVGTLAPIVGPGSVFNMSNPGVLPINTTKLNAINIPVNSASQPNNWHTYTINFQYTGSPQPVNNIIIANSTAIVPNGNYQVSQILIDDIELVAGTPLTFTPPTTATCTLVTNLAQYLSYQPTGVVTFSGPNNSVTQVGAQWQFNPSLAGNGNHIITVNYVDILGCPQTASANILVSGVVNPFTIVASACNSGGQATQLSASPIQPGNTLLWQTGNLTVGTTNPINISNNGVYTLTVTNSNNCSNSATIDAGNPVFLTVTAAPACITGTSSGTITASSIYTQNMQYNLDPGPTQTSPVFNNITSAGIFTVTATNTSNNCSASATVSIFHQDACAMQSMLTALPTNFVTQPGSSYKLSGPVTITSSVAWKGIDISMLSTSAKITIASGVTLTIDSSRLHGCSNYWVGIELQPGARLVTRCNTMIEDAEKAVNVLPSSITSGLILDISNTVFNKNKQSIIVANYSPNIATYPFAISKCVFTSRAIPTTGCTLPNWPTVNQLMSTTSVSNNLQSPYNLQNYAIAPLTGVANGYSQPDNFIRLTRVGNTSGTIATPTIREFALLPTDINFMNLFDNGFRAIDIENSNIRIGFGVFQNCFGAVYAVKTGNTANGAGQLPNYSTRLLNGNLNRIFDCRYPIWLQEYTWNDVEGCDIRCTGSIMNYNLTAWPPTTSATVGKVAIYIPSTYIARASIYQNSIYNHHTGVVVHSGAGGSNFTCKIDIKANAIWDKPTGNTLTTTYCSNGIVSSFGNSTTPNYQSPIAAPSINIEGNDVKNAFRAINIYNYNWTKMACNVLSNTITLVSDPNSNIVGTQHGIWLSNSTNVYTKSNTVNGLTPNVNSTTPKRQSNFRHDNNTNQVITCNTSNTGWYGFEFNGPASSTSTQWVQDNNMNNAHYYSYFLNNGAVLGKQPSSGSTNMGNRFNYLPPSGSNANQTYTFNTPAKFSKIYVLNNAPWKPTFNSSNTQDAEYRDFNPNQSIFYVSANALSGCAALPVVPNGIYTVNGSDVSSLVSGAIVFQHKNFELNYMAKMYIYKWLKAEPNYANASTQLQTFYTNANATTSPYRKMYDIELNINEGNYSAALTKLAAFTPANAIETNQKSFYNIDLKARQNITLNAAELLELLRIANECPHTDGACVYDARTLYNKIKLATGDGYFSFTDDCDPSGLYKMKPQQLDSKFTAQVYPNPTNAGFYIATNASADQDIQVAIYDLQGRIVARKDSRTMLNITYIDLTLPQGLYIVHVTNASNEVITQKLMVE